MAWFNGGNEEGVEKKMKEVQEYLDQKETRSVRSMIFGSKKQHEPAGKPSKDAALEKAEETGQEDESVKGGSATLKAVAILLCIFAFSHLTGSTTLHSANIFISILQ